MYNIMRTTNSSMLTLHDTGVTHMDFMLKGTGRDQNMQDSLALG